MHPLSHENLAKHVTEVLLDCLFTKDEWDPNTPLRLENLPPGTVKVPGLMTDFFFHHERLESHRAEIVAFIKMIDPTFGPVYQGGGGGWTILCLPFTADKKRWGSLREAEFLYLLAAGIGHAQYLLPRRRWGDFLEGMPYVIIGQEKLQVVNPEVTT